MTYRYDLAGRATGVSDNSSAIASAVPPGGTPVIYATSMTYDALNRPTGTTFGSVSTATAPGTAASVVFTHTYNKVNQRVSQTATDNSWIDYPASTTSYTADALNRYATVGGVIPTYDSNGNLTSDGTYTYVYDPENRLVSASGAGNTAAYTFDAQGRRKTRTVNGTTTVSVTDAQSREVLEYNGSTGALLRWYAYGLGPNDVLGQMNIPANTRTTPVPDLLGSIIASMDTSTGTLTKFAYRPYGATTAAPTPFGFTGQRFDQESGLYYYRARHYSPTLGRFLQPDPIGYAGGVNLYAYVGNDPLNLIDPAGFSALQAIQAAQQAAFQAALQAAQQALAQANAARMVAGLQATSVGQSQFGGNQTSSPRQATSVSALNLEPIGPAFGTTGDEDLEAERNVYTPCLLVGNGALPCGPEMGGGGGGGGGSRSGKPTPNLNQLGRQFGLNANSATSQQLLNNLDTPVKTFISQYRSPTILREFPGQYLNGTVGDALRSGNTAVRKLLVDGRFVK